MQVITSAGHFAVPEGEPNQYRDHLVGPDMSIGTYCIPVGGKDGQEPHDADETYIVVRGRARLLTDDTAIDVAPGTVVHIPRGEAHWFTDVTCDLSVVVVFGADRR